MSKIKHGPWPLGIDMVSDETRLPTDDRGRVVAVRDAVNVDFDEAGQAARRRGFALLDGTPAHSIYSCAAGTFCMTGATLNRVTIGAGSAILDPIATMPGPEPVSYDMLGADVAFSSAKRIGIITASGVQPLGVDEPGGFTLSAAAAGGLYAGRYGVVVTQVSESGEESAASALAMVSVAPGGGLQLSGLAHTLPLRVYRTEADGDVLRRCADVPVGMSQFLIGAGQVGRACSTRHLARTPPGRIVRVWMGRLFVARGRTLYWSEPYQYGLVDPRHNFIQLPRYITMVRPVDSGIFVGTSEGVRFFRGTSPGDLIEQVTGGKPPVPGTDTEIDSSALSGDASNGTRAAVWLASNGFVLASSSGQLYEPQAKRIRLVAQAGGIAVNDRRLIAIVN